MHFLLSFVTKKTKETVVFIGEKSDVKICEHMRTPPISPPRVCDYHHQPPHQPRMQMNTTCLNHQCQQFIMQLFHPSCCCHIIDRCPQVEQNHRHDVRFIFSMIPHNIAIPLSRTYGSCTFMTETPFAKCHQLGSIHHFKNNSEFASGRPIQFNSFTSTDHHSRMPTSGLVDVAGGLVSGAAGVLVGQPLDGKWQRKPVGCGCV